MIFWRTDSLFCGKATAVASVHWTLAKSCIFYDGPVGGRIRLHFHSQSVMKIDVRLGRALAGNARPRCIKLFESVLNTKSPTPNGVGLFVVGEDGFEPSKRYAADLQSVPFGHSGTPPYSIRLSEWSRQTDSNPRPADYKSAALPTELCRRLKQNTLIIATGGPNVKNFFRFFVKKLRRVKNLK